MKYYTILFLFASLSVAAQSEFIELETEKVTTLIFDKEIVFFNANLAPSYLVFISDFNKLQVSALKDFEKGVINVELIDGRIFTFECRAKAQNEKAQFFLDKRDQEKRTQSSYENREGKEERSVEDNYIITDPAVLERVNRGIGKLKKLPNSPTKDLGFYSFGVKAVVSKLYGDKDHLYFSLLVNNKSGMIYEIDYMNFTYSNVNRFRLFGKNQTYDVEVFPTYEQKGKKIEAYQIQALHFAIPIFAINEKSTLIISCTERNGFRNIRIPIKGKRLIKLLNRSL